MMCDALLKDQEQSTHNGTQIVGNATTMVVRKEDRRLLRSCHCGVGRSVNRKPKIQQKLLRGKRNPTGRNYFGLQRRPSSNILLLLLFGIIVCVLTTSVNLRWWTTTSQVSSYYYKYYYNSEHLQSERLAFSAPPPPPLETKDAAGLPEETTISTTTLERQTAIVLTSFGNSTKSPLVERCLRSIRVGGNWTGDVWLITDDTERYRNISQLVHVLPVKVEDVTPPSNTAFRKTLYWMIKSRVLAYVPETLPYVLYMDIDVVVAKDLHAFFRHYQDIIIRNNNNIINNNNDQKRNNQNNYYNGHMAMFYETWSKEHHAGIIMLERNVSEPCVSLWRRKFEESPHVRSDQRFLKWIHRDNKQRQCQLLTLNFTQHLSMPHARHLRRMEVSTFVHLTSYSAVRIDPKLQRQYLKHALQITSDTDNYLTQVSQF